MCDFIVKPPFVTIKDSYSLNISFFIIVISLLLRGSH